MIDPVIISTGMIKVEAELNDKARETLREWCFMFLKGGGAYSVQDWNGFSLETKSAFIQANNDIKIELIKAHISLLSDSYKKDDKQGDNGIDDALNRILDIAVERVR